MSDAEVFAKPPSPPSSSFNRIILTLMLISITPLSNSGAQGFTEITDGSNPIVGDQTFIDYSGAAWGDYDNDGWEDLIVASSGVNFLYHNDGNGSFTRVTAAVAGDIVTDISNFRGCSWGDYDNDGDLDCMVVGNVSWLYRNNGGPPWFTHVTDADIGTEDNRGWSPAWGDYDNDGNLDLVIAFPNGSVSGGPSTNQMFHNDGPPNYTFTKIDTGAVVAIMEPYTSANWIDFDLDGDLDLFIGAGPASTFPGPDRIFRNQLIETGAAGLSFETSVPMATDLADGQAWNAIDYDNDGDLDAFRTNWGGNDGLALRPNDLYRNDGGTYVKVTTGDIVTEAFVSLANLWEDFDNDGDLDCFVTNDFNAANSYFVNNNDGTFTKVTSGDIVGQNLSNTGATAGDYDNDGDLDIFVQGNGTARILLRNDTDTSANWLKIRCQGVQSNRSAIGAKLWLYATIGGNPVRQHREISAQNSFMCHSSLIVHFGLGDATVADSIIVEWPSGKRTDTTDIAANQLILMPEDCIDFDGDSVVCDDNCPFTFNPDQADADSDGIGDLCDCGCDCFGDPQCDTIVNVFDVVDVVDVAFRSGSIITDPNPNCPRDDTDVNCDDVTNVFDVVDVVDVAFRGADPLATYCDPCTP